MTLTPFAEWLNLTFADFDAAILGFYHYLATLADPIFNPLSRFLAVIGDGAMLCLVLAVVLLLFSHTRKTGLVMAFSVAISALFTNVIIKNLVARPRPYVSEYVEWWEFVGKPTQSEFSFPSGHMTAAVAGMAALCICFFAVHKRHRWGVAPCAIYCALMGASRNYLMVHYPTDVIAGAFVGLIGAALGFLAVTLIYRLIEKHKEKKLCAFMLNADLETLFNKKRFEKE